MRKNMLSNLFLYKIFDNTSFLDPYIIDISKRVNYTKDIFKYNIKFQKLTYYVR